MSQRRLHPDWNCSRCNYRNFGSRAKCKNCSAGTRPSNNKNNNNNNNNQRAGDWNCNDCGFLNFKYRNQCKNCGVNKNANKNPSSSLNKSVSSKNMDNDSKQRHGRGKNKKSKDWQCPQCKLSNFASRDKCRKCNVLKPKNNDNITESKNDNNNDIEMKKKNKIEFAKNNIATVNSRESMLTCIADEVITPQFPTKPKKDCRAFFTGLVVSDKFMNYHTSIVYKIDEFSEYVGAGSYPKNCEAFPKAVTNTFDGIAIDRNTRVIIWEKQNFKGKILLDQVGPAIINNVIWKTQGATFPHLVQAMSKTFDDVELQKNFPQHVRYWSISDMHAWSQGSVKVVGAQ